MERTTTTAGLQASLEVARKQFLAAIGELRPKLHRFCTRMCASALDGEDVLQEALAQAFYNLPSLKDQSRLEPWLFRIAHHKCVDLIRRVAQAGRQRLHGGGEAARALHHSHGRARLWAPQHERIQGRDR